MHKIEIPAEILARSKRTRGRDHILEKIGPAHSAHVIVDLQNGFMAKMGRPPQVGRIAK